jgi:hypothetical protein
MRLIPPKAARLLAAPVEYAQRFVDDLTNVLRLYFNQLDTVLSALLGTNGGQYIQNAHAMLMSDQDQANAGITAVNTVTYNQSVITQGISVQSGGQIWFEQAGQYLVTFTLQVTNRSNTAAVFEVWAAYDGSDYPLSNTRFDIPARKSSLEWSHVVPAITGIFTVEDPTNTYLSIKWWSDNIDVYLETYAAGTSPTRPAIPSVILTVNFVSRLP